MLLKRIFAGVLSAVVVAGTAYYALTYRFFDKPLSEEEQLKFEEKVALPYNFTLAASSVLYDTVKNSMQAVKKGVESSCNAMELNITFDEHGIPYLADGSAYITDSSLRLQEVFERYKNQKYLRYILHLENIGPAEPISKLIMKYELRDKVLLTGFSFDDFKKEDNQFQAFRIAVTIDDRFGSLSDPEALSELFEEYRLNGVYMITCDISEMTQELSDMLYETGAFPLCLSGVNSTYDMYYALSLNPQIIITGFPNEIHEIMMKGNYTDFQRGDTF